MIKIPEYELTDDDFEFISELALFFGITMDEAYQRFLDGNPEGIIAEDDAA